MLVKKVFRFSWLVLIGFSRTIVKAQSYKIRSFDNVLVSIKLSPVLHGRVLAVSCPTETLYLIDHRSRVVLARIGYYARCDLF
jgi:hypothetical protein